MVTQDHAVRRPAASEAATGDAAQRSAFVNSKRQEHPRHPAPLIGMDPDKAGDDLVRLVLVLVETIRQLVERQAIRRVDSGGLDDAEIERLGLALLRLEERMTELKEHFGVSDDDLALRLGSFRELAAEAHDE